MLLYKKITALCCTVFLLAGVSGYTADAAINTEVGSLSGMPLPAPKKSETGKKIILNLASRLLTLYEGTEKVRIYPVAVGAPETPSPVGEFSISEKEEIEKVLKDSELNFSKEQTKTFLNRVKELANKSTKKMSLIAIVNGLVKSHKKKLAEKKDIQNNPTLPAISNKVQIRKQEREKERLRNQNNNSLNEQQQKTKEQQQKTKEQQQKTIDSSRTEKE